MKTFHRSALNISQSIKTIKKFLCEIIKCWLKLKSNHRMKSTYIFSVLTVLLVPLCQSDDNSTTNTSSTTLTTDSTITTKTTTTTTTTTTTEEYWENRGLYGGSYYNYKHDRVHYIHGDYRNSMQDYYSNLNYFRYDKNSSSLDYYIGYGISRMTNDDFKYQDFHHFYHNLNRTISDNETIRMDHIIACHPNASFLCPENTETVCLLNGTINCMSKMSAVASCPKNKTMDCVGSTVPCARNCTSSGRYLEQIWMPCLAKITTVDVYEDTRGMTISRVGGTFILVPAFSIEDKVYCITIIVDPVP